MGSTRASDSIDSDSESDSATSDEPDDIPAHSRELELLAAPQVVSLLKSSFRKSDFREVARILSSREQTLTADLARSEATVAELNRKFEVERARFERLKVKYDRTERDRTDLEEEVGLLRGGEKRLEERIARLLDEIRAKEEEIGRIRKVRASEETRQLGFIVVSDDDEEINGNPNAMRSESKESAPTTAVSPKRKRFYEIVSSDSEDDEEEEDRTPLSQLKLKRCEKRVCDSKEPNDSSLNQLRAYTLWEREGEKVCERGDSCRVPKKEPL